MNETYDLIFLGLNIEDSAKEEAISKLAQLLGLETEMIAKIAEEGLNLPVKSGIPLKDAQKLQLGIHRLGGVCNYRPSTTSAAAPRKLELAPIEFTEEKQVFVCPACDYREDFPKVKEPPAVCPACGIIPSKYTKKSAMEAEREKIKARLLNAHKLREQQDSEQAEREAHAERIRKLEEQIRKELGLPRLINSRFRLLSSAAFIGVFGILLGATLSSVYFNSITLGKANPDAANGTGSSNLNSWILQHLDDPRLPPQQNTLSQVFSMSNQRFLAANGADENSNAKTSAVSDTPPAAADPGKARFDTKSIWQDMPLDGEWDNFLATQAKKLTDSNQTSKAYALANAINTPALKIRALSQLAQHFRNTSNLADGENLFNLMSLYINSLSNVEERIEAHGILAVTLWHMGNEQKASQNLEAAQKLALTISNPVESARTLARVASYQAQAERQTESDANFRRVNTLIQSMEDKSSMLSTYIKLAISYSEAGSKGIGLAILSETLAAVDAQIKDPAQKNKLYKELAKAYVQLGDAGFAASTANKLDTAESDQALYEVTRDLALADLLYDAMKSLEKITPPEFKARASAIVSRIQRTHPEMGAMASSTQERAVEAQGQIKNPIDQSITRGELARYLAHSNQNQAADDWAKKALASTLDIEQTLDRDNAYAILAVNFAKANLIKQAEDAKKGIVSPSLEENVGKEIEKISRLFSNM